MRQDGLSLTQAPPLAVPASFFVAAATCVVASGALLTVYGGSALSTSWAPQTLAFTHLGTLGFVNLIMVGALYQMTPVVAGAQVPAVRLTGVVLVALVVGLAALCVGFFWHPIMIVAMICLGTGFALFIGPVAWALLRAPTKNDTVSGMRLAVFGALTVATLGVIMATGYATHSFIGERSLLIGVHLGLGLAIWIGGLLSAVSYQILPMFYLAPRPPKHTPAALRWMLITSLALLVSAALLHPWLPTSTRWTLFIAMTPGATAMWALHPAISTRSLWRRRRPRSDGSLRYWQTSMAIAPALLPLGLMALFTSDPRWGLLFAWVALWGWAGTVIRGMLCRIVPFLVWFHRFAHLAGKVPIPSTKSLLPEARIRVGFVLHLLVLALGVAAIGTGWSPLAHSTGVALTLAGLWLLFELGTVLARRPAVTEQESRTRRTDRG